MSNINEMTLGEIEEVELLANCSIDELFQDGKPKGRGLRAVAYVMKRRQDPNYKFEDTAKLTQTEAYAFVLGESPKKE